LCPAAPAPPGTPDVWPAPAPPQPAGPRVLDEAFLNGAEDPLAWFLVRPPLDLEQLTSLGL